MVEVFDERGRRVRQVFHGPLSPGEHTFPWDARDAIGGALPAGVYFVHAWGDGADVRCKLVLLR